MKNCLSILFTTFVFDEVVAFSLVSPHLQVKQGNEQEMAGALLQANSDPARCIFFAATVVVMHLLIESTN